MTELERYKKAYATLVGRVDAVITELENSFDDCAAGKASGMLQEALQEVEKYFLEEDPEEE